MSALTPPHLFRAVALHARGDPWAADGVHLRVAASPDLGFPIHPFVALPLKKFATELPQPLPVTWVDERGAPVLAGPFDVGVTGPVRSFILGAGGALTSPDLVFLSVETADDGPRAELLDPQPTPFGQTVLAARVRRPYAFAGARLSQLRLSGSGRVDGLLGLRESDILNDELGDPEVFGLPIGDSRWYARFAGQDSISMAKDRLGAGPARRLGPADRPDGHFPPTAPDDDLNNLFNSLAPLHVDPWLQVAYQSPDPTQHPGSAARTFTGSLGARQGQGAFPAWNMLLTMAADPRIARYLGLYAVLREPPNAGPGRPGGWLIAGEFAIPRPTRKILNQLDIPLTFGPGRQFLNVILSPMFDRLFPDAPEVRAQVGRLSPGDPALGWDIVTVITIGATVIDAAPEPPPPPQARPAGPGRWHASNGGATWVQSLALLGQPPAGTLAFARVAPGGPVSLNPLIPENDPIAGRATALLAHWNDKEPLVTDEFFPEVLTGVDGLRWTPPMLTDAHITIDPGGASWRLWQSDQFGRWSDPSDVKAPLPARPVPRPPVPELDFRTAEVDGSAPASPGTLNVRVVVPAPTQRAPGSLPLKRLEIRVDGGPPDVTVLGGEDEVVRSFPVTPLTPGAKTVVKVAAAFVDDAETRSPEGENDGKAQRTVFDPRPVIPNKTAPTVRWAGRLDPMGKAELALLWNAPIAGTLYRVYLGDQRRLADVLGLANADLPTRAAWADAIHHAAEGGALNDKKQFTLLTEKPLKAGADSVVTFGYQLPGGLRSVQFLRIVPVTEAGEEAGFATCGLTPVAVPLSERPPAPSVRATPVAGGVKVQVQAYGLTDELLKAHAVAADRLPQFRVRRTRDRIAEAIYLPVVKQGILQPPDPGSPVGTPWTAEFVDDAPLPLYVEHSWLAEVRYPPEPAHVAGAGDVPDPLAVRPLFGGPSPDAESTWSALSLPAATTLVEASGPPAPAHATAILQADGSVKLAVEGLPAGHPKAIYQIALWTWVKDGAGEKLLAQPPGADVQVQEVRRQLVPGTARFEHIDTTPDVTAYNVAFVDPLGRQGEAVHIVVKGNI
jgi:hypothetical protein